METRSTLPIPDLVQLSFATLYKTYLPKPLPILESLIFQD